MKKSLFNEKLSLRAEEIEALAKVGTKDKKGKLITRVERRQEAVNHPLHYGGDTTYEVIKVLEAWGLDKSFCLGNAVKYIARHDKKERSLEDLKKALWYLTREIQNREQNV